MKNETNTQLIMLFLFLLIFLVYISLPIKIYYWDGIGFAQKIEDSCRLSPCLFHPNHLIYNLFGYSLYYFVKKLMPDIRALYILQYCNIFLSALCSLIFFNILLNILKAPFKCVILTLLFAFSATWWRFSIDANAYIPSIFFLLASFYFLLPGRLPKPIFVSVLHIMAMLFHQLAVFFFPVAIIGLLIQTRNSDSKYRLNKCLAYFLPASAITIMAYFLGYYLQNNNAGLKGFLMWSTSYSPDVKLSFNIWNNLFFTLRGHIRLLVDGRLSLFLEQSHPFSIFTGLLLLILLIVLTTSAVRNRHKIKQIFKSIVFHESTFKSGLMMLAWIACYVVFLFFWLPHNTFYRLFYLAPLVGLLGFIRVKNDGFPGKRRRTISAVLIVSAIALANLTFYIFPYSQISSNPYLKLALEVNQVLPENSLIYFSEFNADNWLFCYFTPKATWRQLEDKSLTQLEAEIQKKYQKGKNVWFETTTIDHLRSKGEVYKDWLLRHTKDSIKMELKNPKNRYLLYQILP